MSSYLPNKKEIFNELFEIENNWQNVLYVHTPFCIKKCYYCVYGSKVPESKQEIKNFQQYAIPKQIDEYSSIFENTNFSQIYFGGGTPTIVSAEDLENLYQKIPNFQSIPLKATEASPFTINNEHIDLFKRYNFKYVSLGVQSLSQTILKKQNREFVSIDRISRIVSMLNESEIICNVDLIFYLDQEDKLDIEKHELATILKEIRPTSITIHYNYLVKKSYEKQKAVIDLINIIISEYPEYSCVNSLLAQNDIEFDNINAAEYRLSRKYKDFEFYLIKKTPGSYEFGCNMLAIGEYQGFIPKSNFFYISDSIDRMAMKSLYNRYKEFYKDYTETRKKLNLKWNSKVLGDNFFKNQKGYERFIEVLNKYNLPVHDDVIRPKKNKL